MTADDLLGIAVDMIRREAGRPRQTSLKRAVSTAYYALFHALAHGCVSQTVGWRFQSPSYWETVTQVYRAVDHGSARTHFRRCSGDANASPQLKLVAQAFVDLQAARLRADYDPRPSFKRGDASQLVDLAGEAIVLLRGLSEDVKRLLVVQLIAKQR